MSVEKRLFRAYGQGCGRGLLIYALVAVVMVSGFCCVSVLVMAVPGENRAIAWAVGIALFVMLAVGVTVAWAVWAIRRRASTLDDVFIPLGLEGKAYLQNGRQYHGAYHGYPVHVYFSRGPTLTIYLDAPLGVRMGVGRSGALSGAAAKITSKDALEVDDPEFGHLVVYPSHREWASEFLENPQAREGILRLTNEETATEVRVFSIAPSAVMWQVRYLPMRLITTENVRTWLDDLYQLTRLAQSVTPPEHPIQESGLEHTVRSERSKLTMPIVGVTCGVIALMSLCTLGVAGVLMYLTDSGL
jgi:hypothetical protein